MGIIRGVLFFMCTLTLKCLAWGVWLQRLNLNRLAGVCLNGGACGLIRQSAPNLTNVLKSYNLYCLVANVVKLLIGTAWLSSARVVECSIHLLNERNPCCKFQSTFLLKKRFYNA